MPDRLEIEVSVAGVARISADIQRFAQMVGGLGGGGGAGGGGGGGAAAGGGGFMGAVAGLGNIVGAVGGLGRILGAAGSIGTLVTRIAGLAVAGAAAGIAIHGMTQFIRMLVRFANDAKQQLLEFAQLQARLGSTPGGTGMARAVMRGFGLDVPGAAAGARSAQASNPLAAGAAARLGIPFQPYDISSRLDLGKFFIDILRAGIEAAKTNRPQAEADIANLLGPDSTMLLRGGSGVVQRLERLNDIYRQVYSDTNVRNALNLSLAQQELAAHWELLKVNIEARLIPTLIKVIDWINRLWGGQGGSANAQQDNTRAMRENTATVRDLSRGLYGGGARARGAIPRHFQGAGDALRSVYNGNSARLGAYSVGL